MNKRVVSSLVLPIFLLGLLAGCGCSGEASKTDDLTARAKELVESLAAGDFSTPVESFDDTMKGALPADKLEEAWESLVAAAGPFEKQAGTRTDTVGRYDVVYVTCEFEKSSFDLKVVFNDQKEISGLFFVPSQGSAEYEAPSYVDPDSFTEKEVTVGAGEWALPGTLTVPEGDGPFPAVVLVHGSGPNDRDETIGPSKPFRDLAWGLATRGIAVLRYEKRTLEHQVKLAEEYSGLTINEETIDDALAAASLLRDTEGIDAGSVFMLGHSLGGTVIPRIAALDPGIKGLIILAGAARPLEDLLLEQTSYIISLDGTVSEDEKAQLEQLEAQVAKVKDPNLSESTPAAELPPGIPAEYWLDLRGYDPPEVAKSIDRPVLILQGERDYQVTMADYGRWEEALASRNNVTLITYPDLNHLFIEGEGKSTPSEYETAGHVSEAVIDDIAGFVKGPRSP
ncbi:MAG: alpha/beta fold hydrolase [Actinomycetia bacterium]|nr:alpha/beta fold hydrolase [Actinomycetes bacterium]